MAVTRIGNRKIDEIRKTEIITNFLRHPLGSVLIKVGNTRVICSASVEERVPHWMRKQNVKGGWLTAEYGMLPSSTNERFRREATGGKQGGRTVEIQRLIGRALRAAVDLKKLDGITISLDCDVIDADGGTRCASITGACVALQLAVEKLLKQGKLKSSPIIQSLAAVSVGIKDGTPILDLNYEEDSTAEVDMNIIMTESGEFVEIQGTAEGNTFSESQLHDMLKLGRKGTEELFKIQKSILNQN
ncbi:MAG: ribonuclease PH [Verrucomicrobiota bacterium]|nr:ribonuclease PH [Verrucomicrobiota bacterium]